jgi:hypothetical protein
MENNYIVLPSGKIVQTDDIIYVGSPKEMSKLFNDEFGFSVVWASRVETIFKYNTMRDANHDYEILKNTLLGDCDWKYNDKSTMICS